MAIIRQAKPDDVPRVMEMVTAFLNATSYKTITPDRDLLGHRIAGFISGLTGKLLLAEQDGQVVGMIAAVVYPHLLTGVMQGSEIVWWVDEDARKSGAGLQLLAAAETWYRAMGAETSHVVSWGDDRLDRLFTRIGYQPYEKVFVKKLEGR